MRDTGSIPGLRRSPGGAHGNPLMYSGLENPMDRGAWWAAVHRVTRSRKGLKQLTMNASLYMWSKQVFVSLLYFILKFAVNLKLL